jgi:RIO kinase 1
VDVDSVMQSIIDAREEAIIRQQGRELAQAEG